MIRHAVPFLSRLYALPRDRNECHPSGHGCVQYRPRYSSSGYQARHQYCLHEALLAPL